MIEKKEILTVDAIKKELSKKKDDQKKEFLKELLSDEDYKEIRMELIKDLGSLVTKGKASYNLIYDSLNEGLEPIYFWILDFMRDSNPAGLGLIVWKGQEEYEASVTSGYFGEMGQRASLMQQKAVEYLGTVNNIIKSVLNIIYDLREFEIRLEPYNKLKDENETSEEKRAALFSLKGIWMDQVDARKGRGSINLLAQDLQFVTLRDAFFYVEKTEQIKVLDLNERVKNILTRKLDEFETWRKYSEEEIKKRYEIERTYLKSQKGTLELYAKWIRPYLIAAQKLKMKNLTPEGMKNPNIVNAFSNMEMEISLLGKKEITPEAIHPSYKGLELKRKYYAVVEVIMKFRSLPAAVSGQGGRQYVHAGRTDITFKSYFLDNIELEALESLELLEDLGLIENYIGESLDQLKKDIETYTMPKKEEKMGKKKVKTKLTNPFGDLFQGFKEVYDPLKEAIIPAKKKDVHLVEGDLAGHTTKTAQGLAYLIYNSYKKTHGMLST